MYKQQTESTHAQLDLFSTGIVCAHCNQDPGRDPRNYNLWNGFKDGDTGQYVCRSCGKVKYSGSKGIYWGIHYSRKQKAMYAGSDTMTHSEFPVPIN